MMDFELVPREVFLSRFPKMGATYFPRLAKRTFDRQTDYKGYRFIMLGAGQGEWYAYRGQISDEELKELGETRQVFFKEAKPPPQPR